MGYYKKLKMEEEESSRETKKEAKKLTLAEEYAQIQADYLKQASRKAKRKIDRL